jgi:hypothetical protein
MFAVILIYAVTRYCQIMFPEWAKLQALVGLVLTVTYCVLDYARFLQR